MEDLFEFLTDTWGTGSEVPGHVGFVAQDESDLYVARCTCGWIDPRFFDTVPGAQVWVDLHEFDVQTRAD